MIIRIILLSLLLCAPLHSAYVLKGGKFRNVKTLASLPAQDHYDLGTKAMEDNNWAEAQKQFTIVTENFPTSESFHDAYFYLGVAEFNQDELDFANEAFSNYLKSKNNPKFFQDAIVYKYEIAAKLANGYKRRFFGMKKMPKWASGSALALTIFDEVIAALPSNDLAARALYAKGILLWDMKEYRNAIENYQLLIRRFPKHELVPESYQAISKVFLEQSQHELQNPDILTFAEINLRKYKQEYPRDEGVQTVEQDLADMKEIYAQGLYETARFYERVGKPHASSIYYQSAVQKFPDAEISKHAQTKLDAYNSKEKR